MGSEIKTACTVTTFCFVFVQSIVYISDKYYIQNETILQVTFSLTSKLQFYMRELISLLCHLIFLWVHTPNFPPEIFFTKNMCSKQSGNWILNFVNIFMYQYIIHNLSLFPPFTFASNSYWTVSFSFDQRWNWYNLQVIYF